MTFGRWNSRNRITKEIREQILHAYLGDPIKGTELAMSNGLTAAYAYKLAYERGLLHDSRCEAAWAQPFSEIGINMIVLAPKTKAMP